MAGAPHSRFFKTPATNRVLTILFVLFLGVYFDLLVPAHHHDDEQEHADCAICMVLVQPAEIAVTFCFLLFLSIILETVKSFPRFTSREHTSVYNSRAPPALTPAS